MVVDFFADETTVFMLQLGNFLTSEFGCFATGRVRDGRVWRHGKETAVYKVGWMLIAIDLLTRNLCACICVHVCVCPLVVLIFSKVSNGCLDFNIFQVLIHLLALLGILMDICKSRHTICHSSGEQWSKLEFQLTDKSSFVVVQFWCQDLKHGPEAVEVFCHL